MSRDKQIREMEQIGSKHPCDREDCSKCLAMNRRCNDFLFAERLYNAGYRKASDLAEEIFAEIEETFKECLWFLENHPSDYPRMDRTKINVYKDNLQYIGEIKNKYKGE